MNWDTMPKMQEPDFETEVETALAFVAKSVSAQAQTESALRSKLRARTFSPKVIDECIERATYYKLIDDAGYATSFVTSRSRRGYGPRRIRMDLAKKGLGRELIDPNLDVPDWNHGCFCALERKARNLDVLDPKVRAKVQRFLVARGFSFDQISAAFAKFGGGQ